MTWRPAIWKLRDRPLRPKERELVDETLALIAKALGVRQCACGLPADEGIANGARCRGCWDKER